MKKRLIGSVVLGVLLAAVAVGTVWAGQNGEQNVPVETRTQTRTIEQSSDCPAEPKAVRLEVERQLQRGSQGRMFRIQRKTFQ